MYDGTFRAEVSNLTACVRGFGFISQSEELLLWLTLFLILFRVMRKTQPIYGAYNSYGCSPIALINVSDCVLSLTQCKL